MKLKGSQIEFVEQDLHRRGIVYDPLHEDLVDHICCEVELKMDEGMTFMDAYLLAIRPYTKRRLSELNSETTSYLNSLTMIQSYLTLTFRYIIKHKLFSAINICGLSIGMAACFFILQYVNYELSFDGFHENSNSIYRITQQSTRRNGEPFHTATAYLPIAKLAKEEFPEIRDYNRLYYLDRHAIVSFEDKKFEQEAILYADANFFTFFSFKLLKGNLDEVLKEVNSAVVSESVAIKYFGHADPIGKLVRFTEESNDLTLLITGIFKDPPANAHIRPKMVVSMSSIENLPETKENYWNWPFYMSYVLLQPESDPGVLESKLSGFVSKYFPREEVSSNLFLQPLEDIHLYSQLNYEAEVNGDAKLVFLLSAVAALILLIAYANYINLSTARSLDRAKEVGIRKTLGSRKAWLVNQFLVEAMVINCIALVLAALFVQVSMGTFQNYTGVEINLFEFSGPWFFAVVLILFLMGSTLSSLYPAFVLSSFQPITALRGKLSSTLDNHGLRRLLVMFQFVASIGLMIAAFAIYSQLKFMQAQPLGINMDDVLVVKGPRIDETTPQSEDPFIVRASANPDILSMSLSGSVPGIWTGKAQGVTRQGSEQGKDSFYSVVDIDNRFIETYRLEILAGRNFNQNVNSNTGSVIINQSALHQLGFASAEEAIGSTITSRNNSYEVLGVIHDYHHFSLKEKIEPVLLFPTQGRSKEYYSVKIKRGQAENAIASLQEHWKSVYPDNPFEYFFLSSSFNAQYAGDVQFEKIFSAFSLLAVFIACLGLYGLVSFVTMKRTKEIGIRKVLGSSVHEIIILLATDFTKLILAAGLIAIPLAYLGVQSWQRNFAFRVDLTGWIFLIPVFMILVIALLTISVQTLRAARVNPVDILKDD